MCNLYSITTNQEAIIRLFRQVNRYVGNLAPMPASSRTTLRRVIRNTGTRTAGRSCKRVGITTLTIDTDAPQYFS